MFVDRLVVPLIHLRHGLPHLVLALLAGVDRSTVIRAIRGIRGLLAERGCAVPDRPGRRPIRPGTPGQQRLQHRPLHIGEISPPHEP